MENNTNKWYILNVISGQENKIATEIRSMILKGSLEKYVLEALVPVKQIIKVKKGKKVQEAQKIFPGYIFINANLNSDAYSIINAIPKVMGFLGGKNNPEAVSDVKMQGILNASNEQAVGKAGFEMGEVVNVTEGPFESFSGTVEEFDAEKQRVKISILIFGRATSVELETSQVEKTS
jgi:transcriptional antiterminator NusG